MRSGNAGTMRHREAWELIPFYVNGSLDAGDLERIEEHLSACDTCRREIAVEERWAREIRASEELVYVPERAFAELRGRLTGTSRSAADPAAVAAGTSRPSWWRRAREGGSTGLRLAVLAQAAAIVALVGVLWLQPATPRFRTVSDVGAETTVPGATVRVVFRDDVTETELRDLLLGAGLRFVDGPSPRGVYSLAGAPERLDAAVAALRASGRVVLAEPQ